MRTRPQIHPSRDPRLNRPWSCCGDVNSPDFGHLWAVGSIAGKGTGLYFDAQRTDFAFWTCKTLVEGQVVAEVGRDWIVTFAEGSPVYADADAARAA